VINVEDVYNSAALVDPVHDAICPAPGAVAASELEHRFADPLDCSQARHCETPVQRQQQFPEAGWRSLVLSRVAVPKFLLPRSA